MKTCKKYDELHPKWKSQIQVLIRKMCGKSNVADIDIEESDLKGYDLKVIVYKYSNSGYKGWATIGYLRNDLFKGGLWRLAYKPRLAKGEQSDAGRTAKYS